jgi:plastocyanin
MPEVVRDLPTKNQGNADSIRDFTHVPSRDAWYNTHIPVATRKLTDRGSRGGHMFRTRFLLIGLVAIAFASAAPAKAQTAAQLARTTPHLIVVKLVDNPGSKLPFAFDPATITAERGDTLEFVQWASTMHNVHFKSEPKGAKLGAAAMSPYLTTKGEKFNLVLDSRFTDGKYEIVCDPHEMIGMHAVLTVEGTATGAAKHR